MEPADVLKLRVILDDVNAERLVLPSRPETVNALIFEVKNKLNLAYDFCLQFQDPEFDNALCNLVTTEDLPSKVPIKLDSEFYRITNQNLQYSLFAALDKYIPQLLKLYKKRKIGSFGEKMEELLMEYEEQDKNDITAARTAALAGLPLYFKEDPPEVFKTCKDELGVSQEGAVGLVSVVNEEEGPAGLPFGTYHVSIVLEDQVVMAHRSWTDSVVILFGLIYALHLSCPEKLSCFFEFIQIVLLNLDDGRKQLKPKLQALRNELE